MILNSLKTTLLLSGSDVDIERRKTNGIQRLLAKIRVRAEISKVRNSRVFYSRGGEHFERLRELTQHEDSNALIFSIDGEETLSKRKVLYHFYKTVELAEIKDREERDLVPYSLRHLN